MTRTRLSNARVLLTAALLCAGMAIPGQPGILQAAARQAAPAPAIPVPVTVLGSFAAGAYPTGLVYGPDQAFWFTLGSANAIGELALPGAPQEFDLPAPASRPYDLAIGPDQALWFTEQAAGKIGRFDPTTAAFLEFPLENSAGLPSQITLGQEGCLWYTEFDGNQIGKICPDGAPAGFPLTVPFSRPLGITTAPDGALWFTEWGSSQIGRLTASGALTEYPIPGGTTRPGTITVGPDGALWFTVEVGKTVGRLDPASGSMQMFALNTQSASLLDLASGPDGYLWFLGVTTVGRFSASAGGPANLMEHAITPVFESEGRSQISAGPGAAMAFITANSQEVYAAAIADAISWRDLQVFVSGLPDTVLAGGNFSVQVELQNWSENAANMVRLELPLDDGISFQNLDGPSGSIACSQAGLTVTCPLGTLAGSSRLTLTLEMKAARMTAMPTTRRMDFRVGLQEPDFQPANNRTYRDIQVVPYLDYFNDFSNGSDTHWQPSQTNQTTGGLAYLGLFDNQKVTFTWKNLPPHDMVAICFDLYILGEWDGELAVEPGLSAALSNFIGPDLWSFYLNEYRGLVASFSNRAGAGQSFPDLYTAANRPAQYGAVETGDFDDLPPDGDARYRTCARKADAFATLTATFYGLNLNETFDERWALDNVQVRVFYEAAFDLLYLPLMAK